MKKKNIILLLISLTLISKGFTQEKKVQQVQPSIMVMPWTKEGQDIRTVYENDFNVRIAITKVKEAFDKRGFTTKDFVTKLKQALKEISLQKDDKTDLAKMVGQMSGADIIVLVDMKYNKTSSGSYVKLSLLANDRVTGEALANTTGDSGKFYTDDVDRLAEKAIESCVEGFLDTLNAKFSDIVENGRTIRITITFDNNSDYDMYSEIGNDGDVLSDIIDDWLSDNAYKNNYHVENITETAMFVDVFKIPLRDERGRNYKARKVARDLRKFLKKNYGLNVQYGKENNETGVSLRIL